MPIFGTRPEAIKMAPVIRALKTCTWAEVTLTVTAQHRDMLDSVLSVFGMKPDADLNVMQPGQDLWEVTSRVLLGLRDLFQNARPDVVLVQGDTTTVMAAALAAQYADIPVGHVEAGLRTRDKRHPFPEEINRRVTGVLADWHFAPTEQARGHLLAEGIPASRVEVTGNTVVDALFWALDLLETSTDPELHRIQHWAGDNLGDRPVVLITAHRRESFGAPFVEMCQAMRDIAVGHAGVELVYPVHMNPRVRQPVQEILHGLSNVHLIEPAAYLPFVWLMKRAHLVLTDSGGIQEEAPSLGKPVLVMRETTERPEGLAAGTSILVGRQRETIADAVSRLLDDPRAHAAIAHLPNPYGDGHAAERITGFLASVAQGMG